MFREWSCLSLNIWANEYLNNFVLHVSDGIKLALFPNSFNWFTRRQPVFSVPTTSDSPPRTEFQRRRPGLKQPPNFETVATVNISSWRLRLFRRVVIFVRVVLRECTPNAKLILFGIETVFFALKFDSPSRTISSNTQRVWSKFFDGSHTSTRNNQEIVQKYNPEPSQIYSSY